jgi:hypothetical protein
MASSSTTKISPTAKALAYQIVVESRQDLASQAHHNKPFKTVCNTSISAGALTFQAVQQDLSDFCVFNNLKCVILLKEIYAP